MMLLKMLPMIPEDAVLLRFLFVRSCAAFKVLLPTTLEAGQSPSSIPSFGKSQPPLLQSPRQLCRADEIDLPGVRGGAW